MPVCKIENGGWLHNVCSEKGRKGKSDMLKNWRVPYKTIKSSKAWGKFYNSTKSFLKTNFEFVISYFGILQFLSD